MAARGTPQRRLDRSLMAGVGAVALVLAMLISSSVVADTSRLPRLTNVVTAQDPARASEPGLFGQIAHWLDHSVDGLGKELKDALGGVERLGDRTHDAVKGAVKDVSAPAVSLPPLPDVRIINRRTICPAATNGAPDCRRAAEAVCRRHGFRSGRSLETRSEEKCSLRAMIARRAGQPGTCRDETYVLRSMCQ
jgi:hypothetical protein